jgi:hypothetical protein
LIGWVTAASGLPLRSSSILEIRVKRFFPHDLLPRFLTPLDQFVQNFDVSGCAAAFLHITKWFCDLTKWFCVITK